MRRFGTIVTRSGKYLGRYKKDGTTYYTPAFPTRREAERELKIINGKILSGEWEEEHPPKPDPVVSALFKDMWEARMLEAQKTASPNSIRAYTSAGNKYFLPLYKDKNLSTFTLSDLRKLAKKLDAQGVSNTTFNNIFGLLSGFLSFARKQGVHVPELDFSAVRRKRKPKNKRDALTASQLDAVISFIDPSLRLAFALAGYCALRYGEVAALTVSDIDRQQLTVRVNKSVKRAVGGQLILGEPKTSAGYRTITIPEKIKPMLDAHFAQFLDGKDERLFYSPAGPAGFISDRVLLNRLKKACRQAGVPEVVFHELRHTGLTLFAQAGATLSELMYRAGHSDAKTVMVYQHASLERDRELASKMGY